MKQSQKINKRISKLKQEVYEKTSENLDGFRELRAMFKETDAMFKETDAKFKETDARFEFQELRAMLKENDAKLNTKFEKLLKTVADTSKEVGMARSNGEMAEEWFYTAINPPVTIGNVEYVCIDRNPSRKIKATETQNYLAGEYDIVLTNIDTALVIQVKYKLKSDHIDEFYKKQLPNFRQLHPEYDKPTIYGGLAALTFEKKDLTEKAQQYGLFVFGQGKKHWKILNQDAKPFYKR